MHPELLELLREAKADAPPLRYDADDAVAAGRRLRRRRTTGWAIAAVVAVVTAIGVPLIVARDPAPPVQPAKRIANSPAPGSPVTFAFPFEAFDAGEYRVSDPRSADIAAVTASVGRNANPPTFDGATLYVYRPGLDPLAGYPGAVVSETEPVKGRRAFLFKQDKARDVLQHDHFGWEYADGAVAVLVPEPYGMPRESMRKVAEKFTPGPERAVRLLFKVGQVPSGYSVIEASRVEVRLIPTADAVRRMAEPDHGPADAEQGHPDRTISIKLDIPADLTDGTTCDAEGCHRPVGDDARLTVGGSISEAEARRTLASITLVDGDPAAWLPVGAAMPASALLTHP